MGVLVVVVVACDRTRKRFHHTLINSLLSMANSPDSHTTM